MALLRGQVKLSILTNTGKTMIKCTFNKVRIFWGGSILLANFLTHYFYDIVYLFALMILETCCFEFTVITECQLEKRNSHKKKALLCANNRIC